MNNNKNERAGQKAGKLNNHESQSSKPNDLPDSPRDTEKLQPEETSIDLPDVKDIPGQEFVHAPPLGMLGDTTISSADEEGENVFDRDEADELRNSGNEADVSRDERETLEQADHMPGRDEAGLRAASLDQTDFENEPLNEAGFGNERSGRDLDVPGAELDDRNENIGEEDEENNEYSRGEN